MDYATVISGKNLLLGAAVLAVCSALKSAFPEYFKGHWGMRVLPILPLVLGVIGAFLGVTEAETVADKIVNGLISGFGAGQAFKIAKTSVLGYDVPARAPKIAAVKGGEEPAVEEPAVEEPSGPKES